MASKTQHSVRKKTVPVQKLAYGGQEKKDHFNMYTGILYSLCHICQTQKLRSKSWEFLYRSYCIHTLYTTQPLSTRAATQRSTQTPFFTGSIQNKIHGTFKISPPPPRFKSQTVQPAVNYYSDTTSGPCKQIMLHK